jgi:hypothetical protein
VARSRLVLHFVLAALVAGAAANSFAAEATGAKGPDVTIVLGEERTVYEYRQAGELRMIKIVPKHGRPYYLVPRDDTRGFGNLDEADMLIPRWTIIEF